VENVSGRYVRCESVPTAAATVFGNLDSVKGMIFVRIDEDYLAAKSLIARLNGIGLNVGEINLSGNEASIVCGQQ
jgi:hypothetical protein